MSDLDYDRLLERGRELRLLVRTMAARFIWGDYILEHAGRNREAMSLALLERHLAEKAAEAAVMLAERLNTEGER